MTITIPNWALVLATIGYTLNVIGIFVSVWESRRPPKNFSNGTLLMAGGTTLIGLAILFGT